MFAYCGNDPVNYADCQGNASINVTKEDNIVRITIEKKANGGPIDADIVLEIEVGFSPGFEFEVGELVISLESEGVNIEFPNGANAYYKYSIFCQVPESIESTLDLEGGFGLFAGVSGDGFGFGATYEDSIQSWTVTIRPKIDPISIVPGGGGVSGGASGSFGGGVGYSLHNPTLMYCFM